MILSFSAFYSPRVALRKERRCHGSPLLGRFVFAPWEGYRRELSESTDTLLALREEGSLPVDVCEEGKRPRHGALPLDLKTRGSPCPPSKRLKQAIFSLAKNQTNEAYKIKSLAF